MTRIWSGIGQLLRTDKLNEWNQLDMDTKRKENVERLKETRRRIVDKIEQTWN